VEAGKQGRKRDGYKGRGVIGGERGNLRGLKVAWEGGEGDGFVLTKKGSGGTGEILRGSGDAHLNTGERLYDWL